MSCVFIGKQDNAATASESPFRNVLLHFVSKTLHTAASWVYPSSIHIYIYFILAGLHTPIFGTCILQVS